jgi:transcriptional regulator with XRE-family HTH domain
MSLESLGFRRRPYLNICVGHAVRHLRRRRGVSRWRLARDCGLPYRALVGLELGLLDPTLLLLVRVTAGLRIEPAVLGDEILNEDNVIELHDGRRLRTGRQASERQPERSR